MRRLILPLFLVLCSSGCGGCVGDDNSSSGGQGQKPAENPSLIRPGAFRMPLRPLVPGIKPADSAAAPAAPPAAPSAAPSVAPPPAPSGSAVP